MQLQMPARPTDRAAKVQRFPIPRSDPIYPLWPKIRGEIVKRIRLSNFLINYFRYGNGNTVDSNRTTVVILLDNKDKNRISPTKKTVRSFLDRKELKWVDIVFEEGRILRGASSTEKVND